MAEEIGKFCELSYGFKSNGACKMFIDNAFHCLTIIEEIITTSTVEPKTFKT